MTLRCLAAVGMQWGDEGKGKIIDWLAAGAQHVARFQGGHNAGHTIVCDGQKYVLHLVPSGIIQPGCHCYIGPGVVLSMPSLIAELAELASMIPQLERRVTVSPDCALIMPHHQMLDEASEGAGGKIGTTRRGIGPAHEDKVGRRALRLRDVLDGNFAERLHSSVAHANCLLEHAYQAQPADECAIAQQLAAQAQKLKPYVGDVATKLADARRAGQVILLEASQGALLDIDHGSYPFVTSASCAAAASAAGLGVELNPRVLGISKCYVTRVGNGAFPTELSGTAAEQLTELGSEYGATTARQRRVGWLDIPALRYALRLNGCQRLALTKLDVLGQLDPIRICVGYVREGQQLDGWVAADRILAGCAPRYEELPGGWGSLDGVSCYENLPANCRKFISAVEKLSGARVCVVSFGAARGDTLIIEDPLNGT